MPRRSATITQADIARVIRAAKQAGVSWVEIELGGNKVRIPISPETESATIERKQDIVL